jgi:hypothetical protein
VVTPGAAREGRRATRTLGAAVLCLAVPFLLAWNVASAASSRLYVGDTEKYSIALKAEGDKLYAMELAGRTHCYYTEPHEDVGGGGFSVFPAPKLMRERPRGFVAGETFGDRYGLAEAHLRANLSGGTVTGGYHFDESEESFHCDTGFSERPFQAVRYQPTGSFGAPEAPEKRVYYGREDSFEIFLRTTGREAAGIRGTFHPRCPVGRKKAKAISDPTPLFRRPAFAKRGKKGGFRRRVVQRGRMSSGTPFKEIVSLAARVKPEAVTGTYLRVRTTNPGRSSARRCVTGPIPFRAPRYLPALG